ncbi:MAG: Fic family protein [Bacteroidales bacterium]|nr:Fic family protein [Bacteroidales bacterium]
MATIQEKLAESLAVLKAYQDAHGDNLVIQGADTLGRTHTERLVKSGYLTMVIKGWYIPSSPGSEGDSTVWYVSYWSFVTAYLDERFKGAWCLSPEISLYFHSGKTVIPKQLIVRSEFASNNILQLPFGTSIVDIKAPLPPEVVQEPRYGARIYTMEYALLMVVPDYYRRDALEARTCLASLKDVSPLVSAAIDGGHTTRAGRVAGALRSIGREEMADELLRMMRQVGYTVTEENPFEENVHINTFTVSPYVSRIRLMWMQMREVLLASLKVKPIQQDAASVLAMMDAAYVKDSYNSLSIEGYKITEGLLERVRSGNWEPEKDEEDKERKNALAARGYYQAYELLKQGVADCLSGQAPAQLYVKGHHDWHFQLFEPCIRAGIVKASDLLGYRRHQVYIRNSMHTPLNSDAVLDAMSALSDLMMGEENALVRAVLGHFFFVYIHPYMDGNGRTARFVMNSQLVTAGYPWVVVPVERRQEYMSALEQASVEENIEGFARFIGSLMG